ncbi:hypothetical protein TTHERM_00039300 (macronuclear) [Tetrahymena thermophila SB210]|uniref:Uncharacterized protein n=1 Tax=Tetrahymena thermophila (strain SB210) TaxID=312017 RepID=Q22LY9_TETTS|nr:hypothetical protein TTHERM_00039300 [Tetrahymena thermophila SB210]EAR86421.1 hypothetical protein TTHERM_00039300 [Tetrahymena thermophila SB210]|eukprot:XP_977231.1 hypothetical protein TTHERM_00039300 [Tetrahymena thermophila SB210]
MIDFTWYGKKVLENQDSHFSSADSQESLQNNRSRQHTRRMSLNQTPFFNHMNQDQEEINSIQQKEEGLKTPLSARNSTKKEHSYSVNKNKDQLKDIMKDYPQFNSQVAADYFLNLNNSRLQSFHNKQMKKSSQKLDSSDRNNSIKSQKQNHDQNQDENISMLDSLERDFNIQNEIYKLRYQKISFPQKYNQQSQDQSSLRNLLNRMPLNTISRNSIEQLKKNDQIEQGDDTTVTIKMPKLTSENTQILEIPQITPRRGQIQQIKQNPNNSESNKKIYKNPQNIPKEQQLSNQQRQRRTSFDRDSDLQSFSKQNRNSINSLDSKQFQQKNVQNALKNNYFMKEQNKQYINRENNFKNITQSTNSEIQNDEDDSKSLNLVQQKISKRQQISNHNKSNEEVIQEIYKDIKENNNNKNDSYSKESMTEKNKQEEKYNEQQQKELNRFIYKIQKQVGNYRYSEAIQKFYEFEKKYSIDSVNQQSQLGNSSNNMKKSIQFAYATQQSVNQSKRSKNENQTLDTMNSSQSQQNSQIIEKQKKNNEMKQSVKSQTSQTIQEITQQDQYLDQMDSKINKAFQEQRRQSNTQKNKLLQSNGKEQLQNLVQNRANSQDFQKRQENLDQNQMTDKIDLKKYKNTNNRNSQNQLSPEKLKLLSVPRYLSERAQQKKLKYQFCGRQKCFSPDQNDQNIYKEYQNLLKTNKI